MFNFTFSCSWGFRSVIKEINFYQDIGGSTSFDLELTRDGMNNDQIIMTVLQETRRGKATILLLLAIWYLKIYQQKTIKVD